MDKVCLLITVFNRTPQLEKSLQRLCLLTKPHEVLIIDDGSEKGIENMITQFKGILNIRYIYNNNKEWSICSMARNIGIKNTDCEIVITAEPEIFFVTDAIKQFLEFHKEYPDKVINAGTIYHGGQNAKIDSKMMNSPQEVLSNPRLVNESASYTNPPISIGYAKIQNWTAPFTALYRKEWLLDINGWDEEFTMWGHDDTDMLTRLNINGIGQTNRMEIEAIHQWHEKLPPNVQYSAVMGNEKLMLSKNMDKNNLNNDIKANKDKDWGAIIPR